MGLGSGIRKKHIPDPGSRGQKGTRSRIPYPQHWAWEVGRRKVAAILILLTVRLSNEKIHQSDLFPAL
jgi:hypothetical protein